MSRIIFVLPLFLSLSCTDYEQDASSVGSGAGIEDVQEEKEKGAEDMNITTPIYDEEEIQEEVEKD